MWNIRGTRRKEKGHHSPSSLFATSQERTIAIDFTIPTSCNTSSSPPHIRHLVRFLRIPRLWKSHTCHSTSREPALRLPHKFAERARKTVKIVLAFILGHATCERSPDGNHSSSMRANQQSLWFRRIVVRAGNDGIESVRYSVVELRNRFAVLRRDDARLSFDEVIEMVVQNFDRCRTRMVETCLTVELANTAVDVDFGGFA